jgi:dephospho-CoA kinase
MLKVGLTGGIGSGKSTVARIFETLGIPAYYADDAAKRLMNEDSNLRQAIIKHFGEQAYRGEELDRNYIASHVFRDKEKLKILNSLTHPVTIRDADEWMKKQITPYAVKEAALIFESGSEKKLDYVIGVSAPEELRISRAMKRDDINLDKVKERMAGQLNEEEKMARCDFLIYNDEIQPLIPQVIKLHEHLKSLASTN